MRASAPIRRTAKQRGLTLIELVVVLTILVALGSLLIPMVANALTRSHVATCASNIPEVAKVLQRMQVTTGDYGTGWTTGVIVTGATTGADTPVNNGTIAGQSNTVPVHTLTASEAVSLTEAGITTLFDHDPSIADYDITFNGLAAAGAPTATGIHVIDADGAAMLPPIGTGSKYIWLGIDTTWSGIGVVAPEPSVHFGDTPGALPHERYSRFGAIFRIYNDGDATTGAGATKAEFIRVSYNLVDGAFETADSHIGIHWNEVHGTQ